MFDWTNSYGTQLFLPFSDKRAALDSVFILDIYIIAFFAVAIVIIYFSKKYKFKIALFFSSVTVIYIIIRIILNFSAVSQIKKMSIDSEPIISVGAFPDILLPHNFKCVIETKEKYYTFDYNSLKKERHIMSDYTKNIDDDDEYLQAAKKSYLGKVFLDFARYPYYFMEKKGDDVLINITDMRYRRSRNRRGGGFNARILLSKDKKILKEGFRF
jgi:inner membrane protein